MKSLVITLAAVFAVSLFVVAPRTTQAADNNGSVTVQDVKDGQEQKKRSKTKPDEDDQGQNNQGKSAGSRSN